MNFHISAIFYKKAAMPCAELAQIRYLFNCAALNDLWTLHYWPVFNQAVTGHRFATGYVVLEDDWKEKALDLGKSISAGMRIAPALYFDQLQPDKAEWSILQLAQDEWSRD